MTLEIIAAEALGAVRHGFFTRKGGASSGIFAGLNCGTGSSDMAEAVALNRARVAEAMGVGIGALVTLHQCHSAEVLVLDAPPEGRPAADAMVTRSAGLVLGILTADCQPVLFADPKAGVIGAAHAGWRGARDGILQVTVAAMAGLGADPADIVAVIGPTIGPDAYEVGPEFRADFIARDPANAAFFTPGKGDRSHFDLPAFGLAQLRAAGVGRAEWTGHCTYRDPARFYSHRRTTHAGEADYGRLISVIRL
jgi:YfiH family protein